MPQERPFRPAIFAFSGLSPLVARVTGKSNNHIHCRLEKKAMNTHTHTQVERRGTKFDNFSVQGGQSLYFPPPPPPSMNVSFLFLLYMVKGSLL